MPLKVFFGLLVALSTTVDASSQNQTDCFKIIKNEKFSFDFLPEGLEREASVWEYVVRKIANDTNDFLVKHQRKKSKSSCNTPVMKITFPVISLRNPKLH